MPPDTTRPSRRPPRKLTEAEKKDIELKRIKGEISCAECRRLKLRCDKKVPCGSCCRRGCESICPCGILSAGQGTRFILADTENLHKKIADMSHRIRQLEDALAILQSTVSDQRHPLLQDEMLKVKFGPETIDPRHTSPPNSGVEQAITQSIDALGTLTLGDSGEVKYFGRSAGSEALMLAGDTSDDEGGEEVEPSTNSVGPALESLASLFPFTKDKRLSCETTAILESQLPSQERAWELGESYLKHAASFFRPIKREELFESFLPNIYACAASHHSATTQAAPPSSKAEPSKTFEEPSEGHRNSPHALATLYFLFALGALLDLSLPPYNTEAEHYYELARAALSLRVIYGSPQLDTVQAMGLMATYHCFAGKKYSRESAWCIMGFAVKLAQGIGLHRDSARWNMDPKTVQKRRTLFWEVFTADVSHSLALGRPPGMHLSYVDCEFPQDEEATLDDAGEFQNGFWRMKYTFGRDLFLPVSEATLVAKSPSYATILELDKKVREMSFPTSFKAYVSREDGDDIYFSSSLSLQDFYASQHRTVTMLYLHRSFFAQAMLDHPSNPLLSPFAPSFLIAYRCAAIIIKASAHQFDRCAEMAMRVWFLMYHTFSAAIVVGTVVTHSPSSTVAPSALQDLYQAVNLFERTALQSQRAKIAFGLLQRLKEKAVKSYAQFKSSNASTASSVSPANVSAFASDHHGLDDDDDELAIFGGQKRVLSRKARFKRSTPSVDATSSPTSLSADSSGSPGMHNETSASSPPTTAETISAAHDLGSTSSLLSSGLPLSTAINSGSCSTGVIQTDVGGGDRRSLPPPTLGSHTLQSHVYPSPLPGKQMEDMFSNFLGYNTNQTILNSTISPSTNPSTFTYEQPQVTQPVPQRQGWRELSPDADGLPKPDTSFGWVPPRSSQSFSQSQPYAQSQLPYHDTIYSTPSMFNSTTSSTGAFRNIQESQFQRNYTYNLPSLFPMGQAFSGFQPSSVLDSSDMITDPTEALLQLELMSGSDIDSGWFSFMQDCGIMDTSSTLQDPSGI